MRFFVNALRRPNRLLARLLLGAGFAFVGAEAFGEYNPLVDGPKPDRKSVV